MMRYPLLAALVLWTAPATAQDDALKLSGSLGINAKYNSNLELIDENSTGIARKSAWIGEPKGQLNLGKTWGPDWWLDVKLSGQANLHGGHAEENWYFNRGYLSIGRALGEHALNISSEVRHVTEPDDNRYDFLRHTGILSYKRALSPLWQLRGGYQNIITRYPQSPALDYSVNGGFLEARTTWSFNLSSYYAVDLQYYRGTADPLQTGPLASPDEGWRQTVRAGFDWLFFNRHLLSGTYMFQNDRSEVKVRKIGGFVGHEDTQDNEAEFDLIKQKATLLYSHRFGKRLSLTLYQELIHKRWGDATPKGEDEEDEEDEEEDEESEEDEEDDYRDGEFATARTDWLLLSSTFLKYKWRDDLQIRLRYLFRANHSTIGLADYTDHIIMIGPEFRF